MFLSSSLTVSIIVLFLSNSLSETLIIAPFMLLLILVTSWMPSTNRRSNNGWLMYPLSPASFRYNIVFCFYTTIMMYRYCIKSLITIHQFTLKICILFLCIQINFVHNKSFLFNLYTIMFLINCKTFLSNTFTTIIELKPIESRFPMTFIRATPPTKGTINFLIFFHIKPVSIRIPIW